MIRFINLHTHRKPVSDEIIIRNGFLALTPSQIEKLNYFVSVGLHPWFVTTDFEQKLEKLFTLSKYLNVKTIGEIGLDKAINIPIDLQIKAFEAQLSIAEQADKPVIIHAVKTYSYFIPFLKKAKIPFIFHQFMGNEQELKQLLPYNTYFSFGKNLLNQHQKSQQNFQHLPLNRIFLETDTASSSIETVYLQAAMLKKLEIEQLKKQLFENYCQVFS